MPEPEGVPAPELVLELDPLELAGWLAAPALVVCPWKDLAAAIEIAPVAATAAATIHRFTREISCSPASLTFVALGLTIPMIGPS